MKTTIRVGFNANKIPGGVPGLHQELRPTSDEIRIFWAPTPGWQTRVYITFEQSDPRLATLRALVTEHDADWGELVRDIYALDEVMSARLLVLSPNGECEVSGGPKFGTAYDLTEACQRCGAGARQVGPLIVGGEEIGNLQNAVAAETYVADILVRDNIAAALENSGVTGLDHRGVFESTGVIQRRLPWRQILAHRALPPMSPTTTGLVRDQVCSVCQRNGYFQTPKQATRIAYNDDDLHDIQDINAAWEWFGYSKLEPAMRDSFLPRPMFLVSPKVVKIMMNHGVTAFDFIPIRVVPRQPNLEG